MTEALTPRSMWEQRYGTDTYIYGTDPNEFLRYTGDRRSPCPALTGLARITPDHVGDR